MKVGPSRRGCSCTVWLVSMGGPFPSLGHLLRAPGIPGKSRPAVCALFTYPAIHLSVHLSVHLHPSLRPSVLHPSSHLLICAFIH